MVRIKNKLNVSALILTVYILIIWFAYIYLNITHGLYVFLLISGMAIPTYCISNIIIRKIDGISGRVIKNNPANTMLLFCGAALASFLVMAVWYWAYFPGAFSYDSFEQYAQAITGNYSDWHPVWHTIIFFTLPLKLTGKISSIILFQIVYFSLVMGYLFLTMTAFYGMKAAVISWMYIILNPYTGNIMMYPWKDVAFALGAVLSMIIACRIYYSPDRLLKCWKLFLFAFILACTTLFRHNAVLYTLPLAIALFFHMKRTQWIQLFFATLAILIFIKCPVYHALNVEKPDKRVVETMGMPLTIIGNVVKETPDALDEELSAFAYSMASQEEWEEYYHCGNFNLIKWNGANTSVVEDKGYIGTVRLMLKCFRYSPKASLKAFLALTNIVYGFEDGLKGNFSAEMWPNDFGISYAGNQKAAQFLQAYSSFINNSVFRYMRTYGIVIVIMLTAILGTLKWKQWGSWKKTFLMLPIFAYDFGTMLLLTGDDSRFFYITFMIAPLIVFFAIYQRD